MKGVFDQAIVKAQLRCDWEGNTDKPWEDFGIEWLQKRLYDEIKEYESTKRTGHNDWRELIDVINLACFLYIAHFEEWIERSAKLMRG